MADIQSKQKCGQLPKLILLEVDNKPIGSIQPKPITYHVQFYPDLRKKLENGEKILVYLDRVDIQVCAYPVKLYATELESNFSAKIQKKKFANLSPNFGIPTDLQLKGEPGISGVLYDQKADRVYTKAMQNGLWYLVGDAKNYEIFLGGIFEFASLLYRTWKDSSHNYSSLYFLFDWKLEEEPRPFTVYTPHEANQQINKFLPWLKKFDPELFEKMKSRIEYIERIPMVESSWCEGPEKTRSYAYYEERSGKVFFLPNGIHLLVKGEYQKVAQILAHEQAHRKSFGNKLVMPFGEMLDHSLNLFFGKVRQSGLVNRIWEYFLGESTLRDLQCRILPINPEDEVYAFTEDYRYAHHREIEKRYPTFMKEQKEYIEDLKYIMDRDFPSAWSFLASQYLFLAQSLKD